MIQYEDIDGEQTTRTVFFNLTKFEVEAEMELEILQDRFQKFMDEVIGDDPSKPTREMTGPEKREMFSMVKTIVRHAYGRREGKLMIKNQEVWDEFEQSGAFSAYIYKLFSSDSGEEVNKFMQGIWPAGLNKPEEVRTAGLEVVPDAPDAEEIQSEWQFKDTLEEYSDAYLESCSDAEFESIANHFMQGRNVPFRLLVIGGKRKGGSATE